MSLIKYHNLLMFRKSPTEMEVLGEDIEITDHTTNAATSSMTASELTQYENDLANIETLKVVHTPLTVLPPGTAFTNLRTLDITNCSNITQIPTSFPASLLTLKASSTKLSSIPARYASLQLLDVSNCKRISSISMPSLQTIVMSHSAVTEITQAINLLRLVALNSKIISVPQAPNLVVIMWSGVANSTLTVDPTNSSLVHVLTSGSEANVQSFHGVVTSIQL